MAHFCGPSTDRTGKSGLSKHPRFRFDILRGEDIQGVNPVCDHFHAYWWQIKPAMGLPQRQDVKLPELRRHSAYAAIFDIEGGHNLGFNFTLRVRLIGTAVTEHFGEMTGLDIAEMKYPDVSHRIYYMSSLAIEERRPIMSVVNAFCPDKPYMNTYALYMPLSNEEGEVSKIMTAADVSYITGETSR